jgi:hypothetical protein
MVKKKCKCSDPGSVTIESKSDMSYAGIKGLLELENIKVKGKKIICLGCNKTLYKEK